MNKIPPQTNDSLPVILEKPSALPTPQQVAWADAELGVIIHFDLQVFEPSYDIRKN